MTAASSFVTRRRYTMKYELVECECIETGKIQSMMDEFSANGEFCNALWRAYEIGVLNWQTERIDEIKHHEYVLGFMVDTCMIGVTRITPNPNHESNGKIGYYIRPSYRHLGYGTILLHLIEDFCLTNEIYLPTAVCSVGNIQSIKTLGNAGWYATGKEYDWVSENTIRKALEFRPKRLVGIT